MNHLDTLYDLYEAAAGLIRAQHHLDSARNDCPNHGLIQLECDRLQTQIDEERKELYELMYTIPASN